jgi:hypothetical protein
MPAQLRVLIERYNQLGRLLPPEDDMEIVVKDPRARAGTKLVLQEMAVVKKQIDHFLLRHGRQASTIRARTIRQW